MTRIDIPNGSPVYACLVEGNTRAEIVIDFGGDPIVLRVGLTTLGHLLTAGDRVLQQARDFADARNIQAQEEEQHHAGV